MDYLNFQMEGYSMTAKIEIVDKPIKADINDVRLQAKLGSKNPTGLPV